MVGPHHLEQLKYTDAGSFRVTVEEWLALRADADRAGKEPRLLIDFEAAGIRLVITEEPYPSQ